MFKSIATKTLLIFVSVSFILFGIINYLSSISDNNIVKIGNEQISSNNFVNYLNNKKMQILQENPNIDMAFLSSPEFTEIQFRAFIVDKLIQDQITDFYLAEPKESLMVSIYNSDLFKDKSGKFNIDVYKSTLNQAGYTESAYMEYAGKISGQQTLMQVIAGHPLSNKELLEHLAKKINTYYIVNVFTTPKIKEIKYSPSSIEIENYYKENLKEFNVATIKDYSFLEIDLSKFKENEMQNKLNELEDLILSSTNLDQIAKAFNVKKQFTKIPPETSNDFLQSNEGTFSEPIHLGENKYRVYYIEKVLPARLLTLTEATPAIIDILQYQKQQETDKNELNIILKQMKIGNSEMIAFRNNLKVKNNVNIYRDTANYPQEIIDNIFKNNKMNTYTKPVYDAEHKLWTFMFIKEIKSLKDTSNKFANDNIIKNSYETSIAQSIGILYQDYLFKNNKITVNSDSLNRLME